jgi:hypothetical protein
MAGWKRVNLKFQAKVLLPVVTVMVLFLTGTMWMVSRRVQTQLQNENQLALRNTETLFATNFERSAEILAHQFTAVTNEPAFIAQAQLFNSGDLKRARDTMQGFLEGPQFKETSVALFADLTGQWLADAAREPFNAACAPLGKAVLESNAPATGVVLVKDSLFEGWWPRRAIPTAACSGPWWSESSWARPRRGS